MIAYTSIPALAALVFKFILFAYAIRSPAKSHNTRLYFALLIFLSLHNLAEVALLNYFPRYGLDRVLSAYGFAYFATYIPFVAILLHLSLRLSIDSPGRYAGYFLLLYVPVLFLEYLLIFTDELVKGFVPFTFSVIRDPGPLYFLFETYVNLYLLSAFVYLVYGSRTARAPAIARTRNRLWLLALTPMVLLMTYLIISHHFGWTKLASTFYVPLAATFFLVVTTYATYQYRLFDIQFYIPGSKVRKRKTAFYGRVQAMIAEIADLNSVGVENIVQRLANTLHCSVALVGGGKPVTALVSGPQFMAEIPQPVLQKIDHIMVANEIADRLPDIYRVLKQHGVAAIVPFHPHSRYACGWLLLGDSFSEQVYTPRDFKFVERLFDRMADVFLDKLLAMRTQLAEAARRMRALERRQEVLRNDMAQLEKVNQQLMQENARLLQYQPADSLSLRARLSSETRATTLTVLGRDKTLFRELRKVFPQAAHFVGAASSGFKRQAAPDVLLCEIESGGEAKLLQALSERPNTAVMLYGAEAGQWAARYKQALLGRLVEVLPEERSPETLAHRVRALAVLRNALQGVFDYQRPLLGQSEPFTRLIAEATRLAALSDPLLIKTADRQEAIALAAFMHHINGSRGELRMVRVGDDVRESDIDKWLEQRPPVLMLDDIGLLPQAVRTALCARLQHMPEVRLLAGCSVEGGMDRLLTPLRPFVLTIPALRERRADLPLLVHYFTLQYNLQTGGTRYLTQSEIDGLLAEHHLEDLITLKHAVFKQLTESAVAMPGVQELAESGGDKTLDQHLAEFEARLILDTLKRCNGNKSQAARLLGLRPNTLHYKLERYALLLEKKGSLE